MAMVPNHSINGCIVVISDAQFPIEPSPLLHYNFKLINAIEDVYKSDQRFIKLQYKMKVSEAKHTTFIYAISALNRPRYVNALKKIFLVLLVEAVFFVGIAAFTLKVFHTHSRRSLVVGSFCVIFGVCTYMSPLTIMGKVVKTKSVQYPFFLSLTSFLNGIVRMVYALLRFDPYILVGNGLGALGGFAQLILFGIYYKSTPKGKAPVSCDM